jgi:hypothetical protein
LEIGKTPQPRLLNLLIKPQRIFMNGITINTVLESGIFAFDDKNKKPIGIKRLAPDKNITDRPNNIIELKPNRIQLFTLEITVIINSYLHRQPPNTLQSVVEDFESDLSDTLERWDLDLKNIDPHYSNLLKKCKKIIKSNLKKHAGEMAQIDTKPNLRRDALVAGLKRSFDEYIKTDITDTFHYITYLLIGCGLEKGKHKTVFNKIFKAHNRLDPN